VRCQGHTTDAPGLEHRPVYNSVRCQGHTTDARGLGLRPVQRIINATIS
jgi:hypothetical protein